MLDDIKATKARLISEFSYTESGAELLMEKLANVSAQLLPHLERWWRTNEAMNISVGGHSVSTLMANNGMNPMAAILTLDWLLRDPDKAAKAIASGDSDTRRPSVSNAGS